MQTVKINLSLPQSVRVKLFINTFQHLQNTVRDIYPECNVYHFKGGHLCRHAASGMDL